MYVCTTKIGQLARNKSRYDEAVNVISRLSMLIIALFFPSEFNLSSYVLDGPKATFKNIFRMFAAMRQGAQYIDICLRFNPASLNIDERNLVLYGLANGYIRQLRKVYHI